MAKFYGWTLSYIKRMSVDDFDSAFQAMLNIEAQDTLNSIMISSWTNMKEKDRDKMHKKLYKQAYPDSFKEVKHVSLSDILRKV